MNRRFKNRPWSIIIPIVLGIAFGFLVSYVVMFLWNATISEIFDVKQINMWQALALFILCKILFGFGKGGKPGGPPWMRRSVSGKFGRLDKEEKENMKAYMRRKWCDWENVEEETSPDNETEIK